MKIKNLGPAVSIHMEDGRIIPLPTGNVVTYPDNTFQNLKDRQKLLAQNVQITTDGGGAWVFPVDPVHPADPVPVLATTNLTGRIGNLVDTDGSAIKLSGVGQDLAPAGFPLIFSPKTTDVNNSSNCARTAVTRTTKDGKTLNGVKMTATGGTNCLMDLGFTGTTIASALVGFYVYVDVAAGETTQATFYLLDTAKAAYYSRVTTFYQSGLYYFCPGKPSDSQSVKWAAGGGAVFGTTSFTNVRVRLDYTSGKTPSLELFGAFENPKPAVSKIAFVADDGYSSVYSIMAPIFDRYRAPLTCAIIADLVGQPGYMSLDNLLDLKSRGHQNTVHGPIGGTGSLVSKYSGAADPQAAAYADVSYHKNFIVSNNLAADGSERCYVYPQGAYQFGNGDTKIMDALRQAGIVGARMTPGTLDPMKPVHGYDPFQTLYCAGHSYNAADETGNISAIIARINEAAASGRDVIVMLHKAVTGTPVNDGLGLEIQDVNLVKLVEAAARNQSAGTQKMTTLSDIVFSHAGVALNRTNF